MTLVDAIILGAALALSRVQRTVKLFDSAVYRNERAHAMHTVTLADGLVPSEYRRRAWEEIKAYEVASHIKSEIVEAVKTEDGFVVKDAHGNEHTSRALIIATGSRDVYPDIPGYAALWGTAIIHCAFCHGYETMGKRIGAIITSPMHALSFAMFKPFATADPLTLLTNGTDRSTLEPQLTALLDKGVQLIEGQIDRLESLQGGEGVRVHLVGGKTVELDYLVHQPPTVQRSESLIKQLGIELDGMGNIVAGPPFQSTSVKGVYAAGDAATMIKAASGAQISGIGAGIGAAHSLMLEDFGTTMPSMPSLPGFSAPGKKL